MNKPIIFANKKESRMKALLADNDYNMHEMPCVVVRSKDDLLEQLSDFKVLKKVCEKKSKRYKREYLNYEHANASEKICKIVFEGKISTSELVKRGAKKIYRTLIVKKHS